MHGFDGHSSNPRDPLHDAPEAARELLRRFGQMADGFPAAQAVYAAANLIINALRQSHASRDAAERAWDEIMGRAKARLMGCYDGAGRKKGVYPYDQHLVVPHLDFRRRN